MSKIKDQLELDKEWADKELESLETAYEYKDSNKEHLHTLDKKPLLGTSTVVGVLAKPLTWWASGLACEKFGWINNKKRVDGKYITIPEKTRLEAILPQLKDIKNETPEQFLARCDEAYKAHSLKLDSSATTGTDMHTVLEEWCKKRMQGEYIELPERFNNFVNWVENEVDEILYSEINCFSRRLWVGGISDLGVRLKDGRHLVVDFKSSKEAYISQFIQGAGYAIQLEENHGLTDKGLKILDVNFKFDGVAVIPFGADNPQPQIKWNMEDLKQGFESCVTLYKLTNN